MQDKAIMFGKRYRPVLALSAPKSESLLQLKRQRPAAMHFSIVGSSLADKTELNSKLDIMNSKLQDILSGVQLSDMHELKTDRKSVV